MKAGSVVRHFLHSQVVGMLKYYSYALSHAWHLRLRQHWLSETLPIQTHSVHLCLRHYIDAMLNFDGDFDANVNADLSSVNTPLHLLTTLVPARALEPSHETFHNN